MAGLAAAVAARWRPSVSTAYVGVTVLATAGFAGVGVLLAAALPFHQWDSFAFAVWSREIAEHGKIDPTFLGPQVAARPLFYELQGLLWWMTGVSFTAGRLLSLAFAVLLIVACFKLATNVGRSRLEGAIAGAIAISIPSFTGQSLSAQTDVPAAALVALAAALATRRCARRLDLVAVLGATTLAVLTKQTALLPLVPLGLVLSFGSLREHRRVVVGAGAAVIAGALVGLAYDEVMALRFHTGLVAFLEEGTTGFWAELADTTRHDAVLRADVLGAAVRLPVLFALVYAFGRLLRLHHRPAAVGALVAGVAWGVAGPLAAGVHGGAFATAEVGFAFIGFVVVLAAAVFVSPTDVPSVRAILVAAALGVPPLAAWVVSATYADRLAATAWPGLAVLAALPLATGVRALARAGPLLALVPAVILVLAMWTSLSGFDGLHGSMWAEFRSLGWSGLQTKTRTMHVVLPALESTLAAAEPQLGEGRLVTGDPMVPWFLPGRVDSATPGRCADLRGERVFILLTGDESTAQAREAGRLATPQQWAACTSPRVRQLTDGSNGYAVFAVARQGRGRRVRRRRVQREQHGADPGDHGGGARDVVARDPPPGPRQLARGVPLRDRARHARRCDRHESRCVQVLAAKRRHRLPITGAAPAEMQRIVAKRMVQFGQAGTLDPRYAAAIWTRGSGVLRRTKCSFARSTSRSRQAPTVTAPTRTCTSFSVSARTSIAPCGCR